MLNLLLESDERVKVWKWQEETKRMSACPPGSKRWKKDDRDFHLNFDLPLNCLLFPV